MLPKCVNCGKDMVEDPNMKGVWKCPSCKSVYITKDAREKLKSIFTVT
jgi:DNA-directed RNA polymerase subunit RPC12/RpoP